MNTIDFAHFYIEHGFSVIPTLEFKGEKRPRVAWKEYQTRRMTHGEVDAVFKPDDGLAMVCGAVSGHLVCMDFDLNAYENFRAWKLRIGFIHQNWLCILTPNGGVHVIFRVSQPVGPSQKLAMDGTFGIRSTLIESRGEGGYFRTIPTTGYQWVKKQSVATSFREIPTVSRADYDGMTQAAATFGTAKQRLVNAKDFADEIEREVLPVPEPKNAMSLEIVLE